LRLSGELDVGALRRGIDRLFARHEALRSVFRMVDEQPRVMLLPAHERVPVLEHDLRGRDDREQALARLCREETTTPFDLAAGPLIRGRLIRTAELEYLFLLTQHHIVSDGWSIGVLVRELGALYQAFAAGKDDPLPSLAIQYPDYAAWQRQWLSGERLQRQVDYWRQALADAPAVLELPTGIRDGMSSIGDFSAESQFFLDNMAKRNVPFDVIGLSYYPKWHGTLDDLQKNMADLAKRYNKQVMVAEYSQLKQQVNDIAFTAPGNKAIGSFIWEPLSTWEGIFDRDGKANAYMDVYPGIAKKYVK